MRRFAKGLAVGIAALALAGAAPAVSAADAPDAHKLALARQLFAGMNMNQLMDSVTKSMGDSMLTQLRKSNPKLSEEQARAISEAIGESARDVLPKVTERMVPLYAQTFSEKELEDSVAFYASPSGKAILAKMPALMSQMGPIMQEITPELIVDMQKRVCAKTDCSKLGKPGQPSS